jgi:hypothetical protein
VPLDRVIDAMAEEVVHEPRARMQTPQWRSAHLVARRGAAILDDAVAGADVMQQEIAERLDALVAERARRRASRRR